MEASGFTVEDYMDDPVEVWPENWATFMLLLELSTQWYVGMNGQTGLRYEVLWRRMDAMGLQGDDREQTYQDVRAMEMAALSEMHKPR